jgi:signal transduction histidine kinase/ligand-binding sensor domain-containing protein
LRALVFLLVNFILIKAQGQKLPFYNYGIDKGLIQSQVLSVTQDKQQHLWIATLSGIDRFDGTNFKHFTKKDGINSVIATCLFTASDDKIWAGTFTGISSFDGIKFVNYIIKQKSENSFFNNILQDKSGLLYAFSQADGLYYFQKNEFVKTVLPLQGVAPTCMFRSAKGDVLVLFQTGEIFSINNGKWEHLYKIKGLQTNEVILAATDLKDTNYLISNKGHLLKISDNSVQIRQIIKATIITSICSDNSENLWVGTQNGIQIFDSKDLSFKAHYNAASGLSDILINKVYKDRNGNMWIASDGEGLFRFSGEMFTKYDKRDGLAGNVVMGFAKDENGNFYIGSKENGLVKYNNVQKKIRFISYSNITKSGVNCLESSSNGNIYVGTVDGRLLQYDGKDFNEIILDARQKQKPAINTIAEANNTLWVASLNGCYYIQKNEVKKVPDINEVVIGLLPLDDSVILISGMKGAYEYHLNGKLNKIKLFENTDILCFYKYKHYVLVGTINEGILFWNRATGKIDTCDVADGLSDNMIFSIYNDSKNILWVGSSTGLQQIIFDEKSKIINVLKFTQADGYEKVENSMNCITEDYTGQIWIGTTKGAFKYNPASTIPVNTPPYIVIKTVSTGYKKAIALSENISSWDNLPVSPILNYNKSDISFTVKGVYFINPNSIIYSYQLVGADTGFSPPTNQSSVSYKSLEPGKYTFRAKAYNGYGIASSNIAEYEFTVTTPFYKTTGFKAAAILFLMAIGFFLQMLFTSIVQKRKKEEEQQRVKEQENIRLRTSEDFHDELGNKLTRISLLTDILEKKIEADDPGKAKIISQIKENVTALYSGTKDIIWSLSPGSDNLLEVLERIQHFGNELFNESSISFSSVGFQDLDKNINLPMDYSRNLIMIYKELLNNVLRHSSATKVELHVTKNFEDEITITLSDDGKGFDPEQVTNGNGLNNINRRAEGIHAVIQIQSGKGAGSSITLKMKIPPKGGYNKKNRTAILL